MNIVIDTNILISGIFWKGTPRKFLSLAFHRDIKPFATIEMMAEYFRIIDKIASKHTNIAKKWKGEIAKIMTIIEKVEEVNVCRDPKDNMFLECAIAAKAYYLVSGDSDLLVLKKIRNIPIISVNQFFLAHPEFDYNQIY